MVDWVLNTPLQRNASLTINGATRGFERPVVSEIIGLESLKDRKWLRKLNFSCILIYNTTNYIRCNINSGND